MEAKDERLQGTQFIKCVSGPGNDSSSLNTYLGDKVTHGPLVKGDHKHPMPWWYETRLTTFPIGACDQDIFYPASDEAIGKTYIQYRHSGPVPGFSDWERIYDAAPWGESDSLPNWLYNSALERLYGKLRGNLDLSVALAEAGTTKRMLQSFARWDRFVQSLPPLRRRSDVYYFFPKLIGNSWLQWTYGWSPLINDVYNAADEAVRRVPKELVVRASTTEKYDNSFSRRFPFVGSPLGKYRRVGAQTVRFKCRYQLPESDFELARWTSLNPVSIAWELMPYSFVVDWFVDVGSALRSLETSVLYRTLFKDGYWSWLQWYDTRVNFDRTYRETVGKGPYRQVHLYRWGSLSATEKYSRFQRTLLSTSPRPRSPTFHVDLSWRRLLSSAALLAQRLGRSG